MVDIFGDLTSNLKDSTDKLKGNAFQQTVILERIVLAIEGVCDELQTMNSTLLEMKKIHQRIKEIANK